MSTVLLLAVPKKNLDAYKNMARKSGAVWKEYGALDYVEAVGERRDEINKKVMDDPRIKEGMKDMPFDGKRMIFGGFNSFLELH